MVKDAQGVIPGVTVTMVNEANGVSRETVTNGVGEYSFPAVEPGTYTVKASVQGFKTFERKGVPISTQQFVGARHHAGDRRARRNDHGHRRVAADRDDQRVDRRRRSTRRRSSRFRAPAAACS